MRLLAMFVVHIAAVVITQVSERVRTVLTSYIGVAALDVRAVVAVYGKWDGVDDKKVTGVVIVPKVAVSINVDRENGYNIVVAAGGRGAPVGEENIEVRVRFAALPAHLGVHFQHPLLKEMRPDFRPVCRWALYIHFFVNPVARLAHEPRIALETGFALHGPLEGHSSHLFVVEAQLRASETTRAHSLLDQTRAQSASGYLSRRGLGWL